jgi:hypothetical protein
MAIVTAGFPEVRVRIFSQAAPLAAQFLRAVLKVRPRKPSHTTPHVAFPHSAEGAANI